MPFGGSPAMNAAYPPGDPAAILQEADRIDTLGGNLTAQGQQAMALVGANDRWQGIAAIGYQVSLASSAASVQQIGGVLVEAAGILQDLAVALTQARQKVDAAVSLHTEAAAQAAEDPLLALANPAIFVPAQAQFGAASEAGADAHRHAAERLNSLHGRLRPPKPKPKKHEPSWRDRVQGVLEWEAKVAPLFLAGVVPGAPGSPQAGWELTKGAGSSIKDTGMLIKDLGTHPVRTSTGVWNGLKWAKDNKVEFLKQVGDVKTFRENPARWLGKLAPDIALTLLTAGAGGVAKGGKVGKVAATADKAASGARAARAARARLIANATPKSIRGLAEKLPRLRRTTPGLDPVRTRRSAYADVWDQMTPVGTTPADLANAPYLAKGVKPPYAPGSTTVNVIFPQPQRLIRLSNGPAEKGTWLVNPSDVAGLNAKEIQRLYGMPSPPTHVTAVDVPAGMRLRRGRTPDRGVRWEVLDNPGDTRLGVGGTTTLRPGQLLAPLVPGAADLAQELQQAGQKHQGES